LQWSCIALAAVFFAAVYLQQSYLRYLLPALLVAAAVSAWALQDLPDRRATHIVVGVIGCVLIGLNARFMYTASWMHATLCRHCAFEAKWRYEYLGRYAALRLVSDWLNVNLPDARIGFLLLHDPTPAGYVGYSRAANWHDTRLYPAILSARSAEDVLALVQATRLTHVVVHIMPGDHEDAITAFRDRYTRPVWQLANYRVAVVTSDASESAPRSASR
jgi:hypothetical protein